MLKKKDFSERRNTFEIVADILKIARRGAKKTRIVYGANLNFKMLSEYLTKLRQAGLVKWSSDYDTIITTEKGREYLEQYHEMTEFVVG